MTGQKEHKKVYEEVMDTIIGRIQAREFNVGDKLPTERQMAEELGVSRPSIREALRALECMGYIRSTVGGGTYISETTADNISLSFSAMMLTDKQFAIDIIEVRKYLEVHMAELAAKNASKAQIARIYKTIHDMLAEVEAGGSGINGDNLFHVEVARASNNKAFAVMVEICYALLFQSPQHQATFKIPRQLETTAEHHMAIFEAIRSGDAEKAKEEMSKHLNATQLILSNLQLPDPD